MMEGLDNVEVASLQQQAELALAASQAAGANYAFPPEQGGTPSTNLGFQTAGLPGQPWRPALPEGVILTKAATPAFSDFFIALDLDQDYHLARHLADRLTQFGIRTTTSLANCQGEDLPWFVLEYANDNIHRGLLSFEAKSLLSQA